MSLAYKNDSILRNRYKLTNVVGQGGMGNVYRAEDLRLPGRLCAIKEVRPDPDLPPDMREQAQSQFLQEASILAQLDHPTLPKVSDFFHEDGREYLVMDFVPGKDLKQILADSREDGHLLTPEQVLPWVRQIVDALSYLHRQSPPVVHRDIKPANIKLTPDGRIKLVDFGLVKLMIADEARTLTVMQGRGTAQYTPLEQYGGDDSYTDVQTDIYALGATVYHLLTDFPPPDAKTRFLNPGNFRSPSQLNSDVPADISEAIIWAMEMHPDNRPQSVVEFYDALTGELRRPGLALPPQPVDELAQALASNRLLILITAVLFLLAIILTVLR